MSKAKLVCVAMPEAFKKGELPKELFEGVNVGDLVKAGDVKIHVVPAMHSSERAAGRSVMCSSLPMVAPFIMRVIPGFLATWR